MENEYNLLTKKVIRFLTSSEDKDEPYVTYPSKNKTFTKAQLAKEIENKTEFGLDAISNLLLLSIDMFDRGKEDMKHIKKV